MNKYEFLACLGEALSGLPQDDIDERLSFYSEMIDDLMDEGYTEWQAVAKIGTVEEITAQVFSEIPFSKLLKQRIKPTKKLEPWELLLIIFGFPVWFPLLVALPISAFAVLLSLYVSAWAIVVALWSVALAMAVASVGGVVFAIVWLCTQNGALSGLAFAGSLVCAGLAILLFYGCKALTQGVAYLTKNLLALTRNLFVWVKKLFVKKGGI